VHCQMYATHYQMMLLGL